MQWNKNLHDLKDKKDFKNVQWVAHPCIFWGIIPSPLSFRRNYWAVWEVLCLKILKVTFCFKTACLASVPPTGLRGERKQLLSLLSPTVYLFFCMQSPT